MIVKFAAADTFPFPIGYPVRPACEDREHEVYFDARFLRVPISEVRVGGIPWGRVAGNPQGGEWSLLTSGRIKFGDDTFGGEVIVYLERYAAA